MKKIILITVVVVIVVVIAIYLYPKQKPIQMAVQAPTSTENILPGWTLCDFAPLGLEFQYPADWNIYVSSKAQGLGGYSEKVKCSDFSTIADSINPGVTVVNASSTQGVNITATKILPQFLQNSTTTLGGRPSYVKSDGSIFINGYEISFNGETPTSTRDSILQTFQYTSQ